LSTPYSRLPEKWQPFQSVHRYLRKKATGLELVLSEKALTVNDILWTTDWQTEPKEWPALPPVYADGLWLDDEALTAADLPGNLRVVLNTESWVLFSEKHSAAKVWGKHLMELGFEQLDSAESGFVLFRIRPVACCGVLR